MPTSIMNEHLAAHVAELFRAFSDTSRVRIISVIIDQEMNVSQLAKLVGVTESAVSHHLKFRRDGKEVFYSVDDPHVIALFQQGVRHMREK